MSTQFPSIWIEIDNILVCTYYREWAPEAVKNIESQLESLKVLANQLEMAAAYDKEIVMMGDMNMCLKKW